ncbi:insoluble matrix shell protein 5-like [Haliotis asinina]|uniref:insoluble matrix shell protein 5-like n=1 Tax=Haliotis asinina TaxID=109174 RepID=UPI0035327398
MMLKLGLLLACLMPVSLCQNKDLDMFGLINMLYLKADKNLDGTITQTELDDIFKGFDANSDGKVTPAEFVPTWMVITHFSRELANAYFVLADLNADGVIDHKDLTILYSRFDIDGNGKVSGQEFNHKWQDIYKESAFAVLFTRADADKNEHLSKAEFTKLFEPFDSDKDNAVTRSEFEAGWTKENFGNKAQADTLFRNLDSNHDNKITSVDTNRLYMTYNANHDSHVDLIELSKISLLVGHI